MRSLTPDEEELWARVVATIHPLSRGTNPSPSPSAPAEEHTARAHRPVAPGGKPPTEGRSYPKPLSARTLDSTWDRRLRSGTIVPDRILDLHCLNLDQAWRAIDEALDCAIRAGERVILLITGHARPDDHNRGRGKIRSAVFDWLAASPHARHIAAVQPAHGRHGGAGSLYIILRRSRGNSTFS